MRIRASVLTPALAVLTVAALISTGILLGQENRGQAVAMLSDSMSDFAEPVSAEAALVAEAPTVGEEADWTEQSAEEIIPMIEPAPAGPGTMAEDPGSTYRSSSDSSASTPRPASATPTTGQKSDSSTSAGAVSKESDEHATVAVHDAESDEPEHQESDSHETQDD